MSVKKNKLGENIKIGIIGWYGHYNYGDERILYCIKKFFSEYDFHICSGWEEAKYQIDYLNKCDYVLIGGGGLILRNITKQISIIRNLKKPFGFIGISVEAKHRDMDEFLNLCKQKADFILVRDKQSKKYFDDHYKVIVGPDLTFLYPFKIMNSIDIKEDICGFNLRYWFYWKSILHGNYHNVMSRMNTRLPFLKKYYFFKKWKPEEVFKVVEGNFSEVLPIPLYFENGFMNDVKVLSKYFKNVPSTFNVNLYNDIRYLIGMRYHSIVFATQCGIPFISLSYQPKNHSYCTDMGLDELSIDIYNIKSLKNKIEYIKKDYHKIRDHLIKYRNINSKKIRYICNAINSLIKERNKK